MGYDEYRLNQYLRQQEQAEALYEAYQNHHDLSDEEMEEVTDSEVERWGEEMEEAAAEEAAERRADYDRERDWDDRY
jgi:hypothetical protein